MIVVNEVPEASHIADMGGRVLRLVALEVLRHKQDGNIIAMIIIDMRRITGGESKWKREKSLASWRISNALTYYQMRRRKRRIKVCITKNEGVKNMKNIYIFK